MVIALRRSLRADEIKLWLTPNQSLVIVCTQANCGVVIDIGIYCYCHYNNIAVSSRNSNLKSFLKIRILANIPPKNPYR